MKKKQEPHFTEEIEEKINKLQDAVENLESGKLNEKAILILLQKACGGMPQKDIQVVLSGIEDLPHLFLKSEEQ